MDSPLSALFQLTRAFKSIGIEYVVVGSLASSFHGEYRASADVDLVADINPQQINPLLRALTGDFYIDDLAVARAIAQGRSFNVIHLAGIFKIDIFIPTTDFDRQQLSRRQLQPVEGMGDIWIATAEDTILAKLRWYWLGQQVSELQWRDIMGVLGTQASSLDMKYLRKWASKLEILDLLERACREID